MIAMTGIIIGYVLIPCGCGSFNLILISEIFISVNMIKIRKLVDCANVSIGKAVAKRKTSKPAKIVAFIGVLVFGWTIRRKPGSHPWLLIP